MSVNIFSASFTSIASAKMFDSINEASPPAPVDGTLERIAIWDEYIEQTSEVVRVPLLFDPALSKAYISRSEHCIAYVPVFQLKVHRIAL